MDSPKPNRNVSDMPWTEWLALLLFVVPGVGVLASIEVTQPLFSYPAPYGPVVLVSVVSLGLGLNMWLRRRFVFDRFWRGLALLTVPLAVLGPIPAQLMNVISLQDWSGQVVGAACLLWLFLALAVGGVTARRLPAHHAP